MGLVHLLWMLAMLVGGPYLVIAGLVRLLRPGEIPRLKRIEPMAYVVTGLLFLAMPGIHNAWTRPGLPQVLIHEGGF